MTTTIVEPHKKFHSYEDIIKLNQPDNPSFTGDRDIYFTNTYLTYKHFFDMNVLFDKKYEGCKFKIEGSSGLKEWGVEVIIINKDYDKYDKEYKIIKKDSKDSRWDIDLTNETIERPKGKYGFEKDTIGKLTIIFPNRDSRVYSKMELNGDEREWNNVPGKTTGGRKASVKKEICGKLRCIYKIQGSRKEHIKYKGSLITVADYKKLMNKA
jgi:hypothetical protein